MQGETFSAFTDEKGVPPRLETAVSYDIYSEIDERNGWKDGEPTPDEHAALIEREAKIFREFFNYCTEGVVLDKAGHGMKKLIRRFVAVATAISPEVLCGERLKATADGRLRPKEVWRDGLPLTLTQLAAQPQVKMDPKELRKLSDEFLKRVGLRPRAVKQ